MSDAAVLITAENEKNTAGGDVNRTDIIFEGKTFPDIEGHINQKQIEALAERGIINGRSETEFAPDLNMSRAEFAVILTMGLGLEQSCGTAFDDVGENDWFYDYINTAYSYGIIKGVSENEFNPNGIITREQAAVMIANAAVLCGLNTVMEYDAARDILAGFSDYTSASGWAFKSLACCCNLGILSNGELEIRPKEAVTRAEIANMLFNLMEISGLIYGVNK